MAEIAAIQQKLPSEVWDAVTWPDYVALQGFWARWPPTIISLAILARISPHHSAGNGDEGDDFASDETLALLETMCGPMPGPSQPGA